MEQLCYSPIALLSSSQLSRRGAPLCLALGQPRWPMGGGGFPTYPPWLYSSLGFQSPPDPPYPPGGRMDAATAATQEVSIQLRGRHTHPLLSGPGATRGVGPAAPAHIILIIVLVVLTITEFTSKKFAWRQAWFFHRRLWNLPVGVCVCVIGICRAMYISIVEGGVTTPIRYPVIHS